MKKVKRTKSGNVRIPPQTLQIAPRPGHLLDYQDCSNEELRNFLTARGGQLQEEDVNSKGKLPIKKQVRIQLIRTLAQMDKDATIPFFDLLPEIRNMVYEELLSYDKRLSRRAYPNLLRTSKQVYNEAAGILLVESTAYIDAYFDSSDGQPPYPHPIMAYAEFRGCLDYYVYHGHSVNHGGQDLSLLSKIQNLHIDLCISSDGVVTGNWPDVSSAIRILAQTFSSLVKLSITVIQEELDIRLGPQGKRDQLVGIFSSLAQFSEKVTVDIRGLDQDTYDAVWKKISSS